MTIKSEASRHSVMTWVSSRVRIRRRPGSVPVRLLGLSLGLSLAMTACSLGSSGDSETSGSSDGGAKNKEVVLATHESWAVPEEVLAECTRETGYRVKVQSSGDAGELTNKLVLTKGSPMADAAYGVDNTFASRAVDEGVFADYTPSKSPGSAAGFEMPDKADAAALTPIDFGDV
jgi:thiamine transport system substrate-binding protein